MYTASTTQQTKRSRSSRGSPAALPNLLPRPSWLAHFLGLHICCNALHMGQRLVLLAAAAMPAPPGVLRPSLAAASALPLAAGLPPLLLLARQWRVLLRLLLLLLLLLRLLLLLLLDSGSILLRSMLLRDRCPLLLCLLCLLFSQWILRQQVGEGQHVSRPARQQKQQQ